MFNFSSVVINLLLLKLFGNNSPEFKFHFIFFLIMCIMEIIYNKINIYLSFCWSYDI